MIRFERDGDEPQFGSGTLDSGHACSLLQAEQQAAGQQCAHGSLHGNDAAVILAQRGLHFVGMVVLEEEAGVAHHVVVDAGKLQC